MHSERNVRLCGAATASPPKGLALDILAKEADSGSDSGSPASSTRRKAAGQRARASKELYTIISGAKSRTVDLQFDLQDQDPPIPVEPPAEMGGKTRLRHCKSLAMLRQELRATP